MSTYSGRLKRKRIMIIQIKTSSWIPHRNMVTTSERRNKGDTILTSDGSA